MKARCVEGPEGQRGARGQGLGRRAGRRRSVSSREPPGAWSWEARRAASAPNAPGGCGPCLRVLWTFSPDPAPVLCHPAHFWGWGCPASPSLHLKGARAQPHCQGPDGEQGAGPLQAPGLICGQHGQTAGENGQPCSPGACDSPARCADRRLPSEGTSRCHHPPLDPSASSRGLGGWQAARIHPEGKRLSEEKKIKTGALPPPRLTMRT